MSQEDQSSSLHDRDPKPGHPFTEEDLRTLAALGISAGNQIPGQRLPDNHETSEVIQDLPDHFNFRALGDSNESYVVDRWLPEANGTLLLTDLDSRPDEITIIVARDTRFEQHPTTLYTLVSSSQNKNGALLAYSVPVTDGFADDSVELPASFQRLATNMLPPEIKAGTTFPDPQVRGSVAGGAKMPYEIEGVYTVRPQVATDELTITTSMNTAIEKFTFGFEEIHELYSGS